MKKTIAAFALIALALSGGAHAAAPKDKANAKGEAALAKLLAGRTAGKPRSCISAQIGTRLRVIDGTALVYDDGRTIYVARPDEPRSLDQRDILVIRRTNNQLCKHDVIHTVDRMSGFMTGIVFLGDFVPYSKG